LVDHIFVTGRHGIVFKGKWYLPFLTSALFKIAGARPFDKRAIDAGVVGALAYSLDYSAAWTKPFVDSTETVVAYVA
jgi:hypothetical protein